MGRVTLRSLWEHKRRLVSTVVAIVLGVAFMSGTLVFADTIDQVFDDLFADVNEHIDVRVQGAELFDGGFGGPPVREVLDIDVVDRVRSVEGVAAAEPFIQVYGFGSQNRVLGPDGDPLGASSGPPTLLESWVADDGLNPYDIAAGSPPAADDEIALNVAAADDAGFELGDEVEVVSQLGPATYTLVGTFTFGEAESAGGSVSADFTLAEAQRLAGLDGRTQEVVVAGDGTVGQEELARRVAEALPPTAEAITGAEAAEQDASQVQEAFSFFRQLLTIFAGIALLVGTFIIANTFAILVAQRTRELALLRAIGASRRQVLGSVLLEASVLGLIAAVVGLLAGVGLALAVTAALEAGGADLPTSGLVVSAPTVVTALVLGLGITVAAAVVPAVHATRVPPLAALREVAVERTGASRLRTGAGVLLLALGAWQLSAAWRLDDDAVEPVGTGALALVVGAIVIGPLLAERSVRLLGAALPRLRGITGALATENAARAPKRTSATASALLIGVALIGFITIFAASARESIEAEVERGFTGDLIVQSELGGFGPPSGFSPTVADRVAEVDGVAQTSRIGFMQAQVRYPGGDVATQFVQSIDPTTLADAFDVRMAEGRVTDLSPGGIIVDVGIAEDEGLQVGDLVTLTGPTGEPLTLEVQAIADDLTLLGFWAIDTQDYERLVTERQLVQLVVTLDDGTDLEAATADIEAAVADVPTIEVLDRDGFVGSLTDQITSFLTLVNALLLLSIVIAMIGIANTLSLSIHERTRELGLLRAVGMTRAQLRSAVRWEAVLIAVLGTVVGLGLGLVVSWALVTALGSFGLTRFALPVGTLVAVTLGAAVLGVIAAIRPARRAARLDVLRAIAFE
ncbi:MAG TPA: FtsX-like permease family protein [Acidimicrobiales bacterium]|nr:FtsX-like permease family protein [Acidimicrobiales bacterium]